MYIAIISVWYGVRRGSPGKFTGVSCPSISTCGGRPTEKLRSETRSDIFSIASRMASRLKFFIGPCLWEHRLYTPPAYNRVVSILGIDYGTRRIGVAVSES